MAAEDEAVEAALVFSGPTALARAFHITGECGYSREIVASPAGGGPCGLALAVAASEADDIRAVLAAYGVPPVRILPRARVAARGRQ